VYIYLRELKIIYFVLLLFRLEIVENPIFTLTRHCCIVTNLFIIKPNRRTNFTNLFWHETLHVSVSSSAHHQEFIHCTLSNGICHTGLKTAFEKDQDGTTVPSWYCSKAVSELVWNIPLRSVQWIKSWWWAHELPETCRVSCQNKFVKLVRLVGFITKICWETFKLKSCRSLSACTVRVRHNCTVTATSAGAVERY
jgi:hypothetical protein